MEVDARRRYGHGAAIGVRDGASSRDKGITRAWLLAPALLAAALCSACVDAQLTANLLPDGSGNVEIDVGYDTTSWPAFLGDPLASYTSRGALRKWTSPGVIAWSRPELVQEGRHRRLRTALWFDDLSRLEFWSRRGGQPFETLGFSFHRDQRVVDVRAGFVPLLDRPLPLPEPERVGMDVSLSPELLDAVRRQIRPVVEGLSARLEVVLPGEVLRADGLPQKKGRTASLEVDADGLARAMNERAGVLFPEEELRRDPPRLEWAQPDGPDPRAETMARRRGQALEWWRPQDR